MTPLNILYIVLSVCIGLLTIFLCVAIFYLINILRDVEKVVYKVEETTDRVNRFVAQPIKIAAKIAEGLDRLVSVVQKRFMDSDGE